MVDNNNFNTPEQALAKTEEIIMIGTLDIKVAAHNPNFPLEPVFTFINSA